MKILYVTSDLDGGGIERLLYNYCKNIVKFATVDFAIVAKKVGILEEPLKKLGCHIYRIPTIHESIKKHNRLLSNIIKNGCYDIVHDHGGYCGLFTMYISKKNNVKIRIEHSHSNNNPENFFEKNKRLVFTPITKYFATDLFACGNDAGMWMWGKKEKFFIMRNAIEIDRYIFNEEQRKVIRKQLQIEDKFVIGNVARFSKQKNHIFLIKIFEKICKIRDDAVLMLIGSGELEEEIKNLTKEKGIIDKILFLGVKDNVDELLNSMDTFVLPSLYEGLPVILVEAQANGLEVFSSDAITNEIELSPNFHRLSLLNSEEVWAREICKSKSYRYLDNCNILEYDIKRASNELISYYQNLIKMRIKNVNKKK